MKTEAILNIFLKKELFMSMTTEQLKISTRWSSKKTLRTLQTATKLFPTPAKSCQSKILKLLRSWGRRRKTLTDGLMTGSMRTSRHRNHAPSLSLHTAMTFAMKTMLLSHDDNVDTVAISRNTREIGRTKKPTKKHKLWSCKQGDHCVPKTSQL